MKRIIMKSTSLVLILSIFNLLYSCETSAPNIDIPSQRITLDLSSLPGLVDASLVDGEFNYSKYKQALAANFGPSVSEDINSFFTERSTSGRLLSEDYADILLNAYDSSLSTLSNTAQYFLEAINETLQTSVDDQGFLTEVSKSDLLDLDDAIQISQDLSPNEKTLLGTLALSFVENADYLNDSMVVLQSESGRSEGFLGAILGAVVGFIAGAIINTIGNDANQFDMFEEGDNRSVMAGMMGSGAVFGFFLIPF